MIQCTFLIPLYLDMILEQRINTLQVNRGYLLRCFIDVALEVPPERCVPTLCEGTRLRSFYLPSGLDVRLTEASVKLKQPRGDIIRFALHQGLGVTPRV